jgi:hypothetical protein
MSPLVGVRRNELPKGVPGLFGAAGERKEMVALHISNLILRPQLEF